MAYIVKILTTFLHALDDLKITEGSMFKQSDKSISNRFRQEFGQIVKLSIAVWFFGCAALAQASGLIVNEASQGPSGAKEFFEFIVVGDAGNPTGTVNVDGWIFDDNNGEWGGGGGGLGTAPGYARFDATTNAAMCSALASIAPGSIIVIYNDGDPNPNLPADDANDANGDGVYVFQARGACIKTCAGPPTTSDISYSTCATAATPSYAPLALRNGGDVAQSRDSSGALFHGFTYGDISTPYPAGSFRIGPASSSTGRSFVFSCGSWFVEANFARITATSDTPGATNNAANETFRQKVIAGSFDYSNLTDPANCTVGVFVDLVITKTNTPGVNGEIDQANDTVTSGSTTTYTLVVTNNGPDSVTGAIVTDTPTSGLTCPGSNAVTITGDGVPSGSFTIADLTVGGIVLGNLGNGEATILVFDCLVN